ncbi:hypothetical protein CLV44_12519 [Marinobacterium halophilum]|uniref:Uncharacterized protein n=1 Tax=Marinobacterium halophilum TaxID=267374 RepID=A0A2P8EN04_9GAMM|nr:hypothetical protein CLV44_12519 [Marinobacterium halophilum]
MKLGASVADETFRSEVADWLATHLGNRPSTCRAFLQALASGVRATLSR